MKSSFYLTTPLYYVNDKPHLGTAYATIMSDVLARYHRFFDEDVYFLTGTDEHGQKCQQAAEKAGLTPQQHCDQMVVNFERAWKDFNISYDVFYRTTAPTHKLAVQKSLQQLFDKGDIYSATYEGWYSVSEEIFYTEKDLVDGKSPTGREVTRVQEKNYFFKMSKYQQALIDHIEKNPTFIMPEAKKNEVLGFLRQPLGDLCISRPKARMSWGIEIPFDKDYVTYVWFDALLNYAVAVGFQQPDKQKDFEHWWNQAGAVHIIGKDILTTHAVYWSTMLLALDTKLPKTIFAHGWILNKSSEKMSKSFGDVVNPMDMKDKVGVDALRYYLTREIHFGNDAPFTVDLLLNRINTELANNLGNLWSRSSQLVEKFFEGRMPSIEPEDVENEPLAKHAVAVAEKLRADINKFQPSHALEHVVLLLNEANKYLEEKAPWKLAKTSLEEAGVVLRLVLEVVRISSILLEPTMPTKMLELQKRMALPEQANKWHAAQTLIGLTTGSQIQKGEPLFPRYE